MNGQFSYALLSVPFLLLALALWCAAWRSCRQDGQSARFVRSSAVSLLVLFVLTAIFDNVIIGTGLVAYDDANRSGIQIGLAPIEDFGYSAAAALGLPALWLLRDRREAQRKTTND